MRLPRYQRRVRDGRQANAGDLQHIVQHEAEPHEHEAHPGAPLRDELPPFTMPDNGKQDGTEKEIPHGRDRHRRPFIEQPLDTDGLEAPYSRSNDE